MCQWLIMNTFLAIITISTHVVTRRNPYQLWITRPWSSSTWLYNSTTRHSELVIWKWWENRIVHTYVHNTHVHKQYTRTYTIHTYVHNTHIRTQYTRTYTIHTYVHNTCTGKCVSDCLLCSCILNVSNVSILLRLHQFNSAWKQVRRPVKKTVVIF